MEIKRGIKAYLSLLVRYLILIGVLIGIRALYGLDLNLTFYAILTSVIATLLLLFSFIDPQHLEKLFPKDSNAALLIVLIFRFLPVMRMKVGNIKHTQEMRGAKFTGLSQIKNYLSLFVPAILVSMNWADRLCEGLLMRGEEE